MAKYGLSKHAELVASEWLRQEIRDVLVRVNVSDQNGVVGNELANPEVAYGDMLGTTIVNRVIEDVDGAQVVLVDDHGHFHPLKL